MMRLESYDGSVMAFATFALLFGFGVPIRNSIQTNFLFCSQ